MIFASTTDIIEGADKLYAIATWLLGLFLVMIGVVACVLLIIFAFVVAIRAVNWWLDWMTR